MSLTKQGDPQWQLVQVRHFSREIKESPDAKPLPAIERLRNLLQTPNLAPQVPQQLFDCTVNLGSAHLKNTDQVSLFPPNFSLFSCYGYQKHGQVPTGSNFIS
jgi:hypothetical protein